MTWAQVLEAFRHDEFVLDPTRLTLVCGTAGYDGTQFKGLLAAEYEIQLNKTSRNSILLQTNINNTRSDVANLLRVLVEISRKIDATLKDGGAPAQAAFAQRVKSLMEDVPGLPNFSRFHDRFRDRSVRHDARGRHALRVLHGVSGGMVRAPARSTARRSTDASRRGHRWCRRTS